MKVLFITMELICDINKRSLYTDVLREFQKQGHQITVISANEKRNWVNEQREWIKCENEEIRYILAKTGNITKNNNFILKGIAVVLAGYQYIRAYRKSNINEKYDLIICTTPSVTFEPMVRYAHKIGGGRVTLLLKDMWPYDLVFDNILSTKGIKGMAYKYFDRIAKKLYRESDMIGCMSPKNIEFLIKSTGDVSLSNKVKLVPNSIDALPRDYVKDRLLLRRNYGIPLDKVVFVYGGNLGAAQGIEFAIEAIDEASKIEDTYFLIVGNGTHADLVKSHFDKYDNVRYMNAIDRDSFESLVYACDVGLTFLVWSCHTPNYPSRILSYMQAGLPIICCTDDTSDVGVIAEQNGWGTWCPSNDILKFVDKVKIYMDERVRILAGEKSRSFVENEYSSKKTYELIIEDSRG